MILIKKSTLHIFKYFDKAEALQTIDQRKIVSPYLVDLSNRKNFAYFQFTKQKNVPSQQKILCCQT